MLITNTIVKIGNAKETTALNEREEKEGNSKIGRERERGGQRNLCCSGNGRITLAYSSLGML